LIRETLNTKSAPALTSDHWHVVYARWSGEAAAIPRFERSIVSEHEDKAAAMEAARRLVSAYHAEMVDRPRHERDQVFVRRPGYLSLKNAKRTGKQRP
jgi:hypothetical protein